MSIASNRRLEQLEHLHSEDTPSCPMITHPYYWAVHIGSKVKTSQSHKFREFAKTSNFWILKIKTPLHMTHLLKFLDKVCKYEMDPVSIVEDTERTRFCPQTDRRGKTSIPPFNFVERGIIMDMTKYSCPNLSLSILVKGPLLFSKAASPGAPLLWRLHKVETFSWDFNAICNEKLWRESFFSFSLIKNGDKLTHWLLADLNEI